MLGCSTCMKLSERATVKYHKAHHISQCGEYQKPLNANASSLSHFEFQLVQKDKQDRIFVIT